MDKVELKKIKEYFTIEKQEFSFFSQKMQNKKHRLYTKNWLPPMRRDLLNLKREPYSKWQPLWFKKNEVSDEIKKRFAENISFQEEILRVIKKRNEQFNYRCWIIKAKTWMWKSVIAMDIIEYLQTTTLILVTNKKLMQEMVDKISEMTNFTPAQYWDGKKQIDFITVMTKKWFALADKEELSDFDTVIIDECHQWFTKWFRDKFNEIYYWSDIYLYWLSATPSTNELDEKDLELYFGKVIEIKKEYDFIPKFTFYNYHHNEDSDFLYTNEETWESYMKKIYEFEHYAELRGNMWEDKHRMQEQISTVSFNLSKKCSLILCDRISEIKQWERHFSIYDEYTLIVITWETKISEDKKLLDDALNIGKPIIIIGSIQKCSTWFDYPIIDTVFIFSAIKFENTVIQSIWRSLRKSPGKNGSEIHVWNDKILDKQRIQKQTAIMSEYWVNKNEINIIDVNKKKKQKGEIALEF